MMMSRVLSAARPMVVRAQPARFFAAAGGFIDRNEVTERVQNVIANFDKVDASKVSPTAHFTNDLGTNCDPFLNIQSISLL